MSCCGGNKDDVVKDNSSSAKEVVDSQGNVAVVKSRGAPAKFVDGEFMTVLQEDLKDEAIFNAFKAFGESYSGNSKEVPKLAKMKADKNPEDKFKKIFKGKGDEYEKPSGDHYVKASDVKPDSLYSQINSMASVRVIVARNFTALDSKGKKKPSKNSGYLCDRMKSEKREVMYGQAKDLLENQQFAMDEDLTKFLKEELYPSNLVREDGQAEEKKEEGDDAPPAPAKLVVDETKFKFIEEGYATDWFGARAVFKAGDYQARINFFEHVSVGKTYKIGKTAKQKSMSDFVDPVIEQLQSAEDEFMVDTDIPIPDFVENAAESKTYILSNDFDPKQPKYGAGVFIEITFKKDKVNEKKTKLTKMNELGFRMEQVGDKWIFSNNADTPDHFTNVAEFKTNLDAAIDLIAIKGGCC